MTEIRTRGRLALLVLMALVASLALAGNSDAKSVRPRDTYTGGTVIANWNGTVTGQPWVVLIHGGTWSAGDNVHYEVGMADLFQRYGWATFNIDYPLIPTVTGEVQKLSVLHTVEWIKSNAAAFHIDPNKGTLYGFSSGGHLAALVGLEYPGLVQDIVTASGVTQPQRLADDILGKRPTTEPISPTWGPYGLSRMNQWTGCDYADPACASAWQAFEPQTFITPSSPPMWMISGAADTGVYPEMTGAFDYWLGKQHVERYATIAPGFGHTEAEILTVSANAQSMLRFVIAHVHAGSW